MVSGCDCVKQPLKFPCFVIHNKQTSMFLSEDTHKHPLRCQHIRLTPRRAGVAFPTLPPRQDRVFAWSTR